MFFRNLSEMRPTETLDLWADFCNDFPEWSEDEIASAVVTLAVAGTDAGVTADATPNNHISGSAVIEESEISSRDTRVVQRVATPSAGNQYRIIFTATTTGGQVLVAEHLFWCRAAS